MRIDQLKHIIGAAANVVEEDEFVVIGSQAVLGTRPDAPEPLLRSMEADLYPRRSPEKADLGGGSSGFAKPVDGARRDHVRTMVEGLTGRRAHAY